MSGPPAGAVEIRLLGPLHLSSGGEALPGPRSAKGAALLALLAGRERPQARDVLRALLWPDASPRKAATSLRVALADLRAQLGDRIEADRRVVRMAPRPEDRIDLRRLAAWEAQDHDGSGLEDIEGTLLEGLAFPEDPELDAWLLRERRRWEIALDALQLRLAEEAARTGRDRAAERYLRRVLRRSPEREAAQRDLMRLLARQGRFDEALGQFAACRDALRERVESPPAPETYALLDRIQAARSRPVRDDLPADITPFLGRRAERARLAAWLRAPDRRLVTIVGPGGVGKTRLAIAAARDAAASLLDGVRFVPLADLSPEDALETAIAKSLDLPLGAEDPRGPLTRALAEREMLLLLDNAEHHADQTALCEPLLAAAPDLRILVTSRQALGLPGEQRLPLAGLALPAGAEDVLSDKPPDAAALFLEAAGRARPDLDLQDQAEGIVALCRLVEGLPLALELAAGRLDARSVPELVAAIAEDVRVLAAPAAGAGRRQASLESVFEGSWALLAAAERTAAARLSVFRGGFEPEAAAAVARVEAPILAALVRRSFLGRRDHGRFEMHALLRQLAEGRLDAHPTLAARVRARHAAHYLALLAREGSALFGPKARQAAARLTPERANLAAAWRHAADQGDLAALDAALEGWLRLVRLRGPYREGLEQLASASRAAQTLRATDDASPEARAVVDLHRLRLRSRRAYLHQRLGEPEEGARLAARTLQEARAIGDRVETRGEQAYALWVLGCIELLDGRHEAAAERFHEGAALARAAGDVETAAENAWQGAVLAFYRDDREGFAGRGEALIETCRAAGLRHLEGRVHESLGGVFARYGEPRRAERHLDAARAIAEEMGDLVGRVNTLGAQAELALHRGRLEEAEALAGEALARARDLGADEAAVVMRWGLARIRLARGDADRAAAELRVCLEDALRGGYRYWEACALTELAHAARLQRQRERAQARIEEALASWAEIGQAWGQAYALAEATALARERGDLDEAAERLEAASRSAEEAGDPYHALELGLERGRLLAAHGEADEAARVWAATRAEAEAVGAERVVAQCEALLDARARGGTPAGARPS